MHRGNLQYAPFVILALCLNSAFSPAQTISSFPGDSLGEANKAVVRRFLVEVWNNGKIDLCDELIGSNAVGHFRGMDFPSSSAETKQVVNRWRSAFDGFHFRIEDLIAEGDRVVAHVPFEGTHAKTFFGIPPTGRKINVDEILICRLQRGKIVEFWEVYDERGMRMQLEAPSDSTKSKAK